MSILLLMAIQSSSWGSLYSVYPNSSKVSIQKWGKGSAPTAFPPLGVQPIQIATNLSGGDCDVGDLLT